MHFSRKSSNIFLLSLRNLHFLGKRLQAIAHLKSVKNGTWNNFWPQKLKNCAQKLEKKFRKICFFWKNHRGDQGKTWEKFFKNKPLGDQDKIFERPPDAYRSTDFMFLFAKWFLQTVICLRNLMTIRSVCKNPVRAAEKHAPFFLFLHTCLLDFIA
jgi:hypothetical protein